jgi:AI-2 transport protein TqsA
MASDHADADRRLQTTCLVVLTMIASATALYFLRPVVVPFLLAIVIVYALQPVIDWQERRFGFPRVVAVAGVGLISLALLAAVGLVAAAFVVKLREHFPIYEAQLRQVSARVSEALKHAPWGIGESRSLFDWPEGTGRDLLTSFLSGGVDIISSTGLVVLFVILMLAGRRSDQPHIGLRSRIDTAIRSYILNMIGLSALTGLLVGGSLALIGVEFALEFGVLAFVLNFIPTIGSLIATLMPVPVVLLSPDLSLAARILALVVPTIIQIVLGSVVQPRVMGKSQDLHPVTVLLAMLFFGTIWGIVGAVLAVPITGVLRIVLANIDGTRMFANWLAGDIGGIEKAARSASTAD